MDTQDQHIIRLRNAIEKTAEREMKTPKDFDYLADSIFEKLHQTVSPTTLKRLWGYLTETTTPRISTLNILAQYVGSDDWECFCRQMTMSDDGITEEPASVSSSEVVDRKRNTWIKWSYLVIAVIAVFVLSIWNFLYGSSPTSDHYVLKKGQTFQTYRDYLKLFGVSDTTDYWGKVLPHHSNIIIWGPEYNHPSWHNDGNKDSMMPTITERWEPEGADSNMVVMRNRDKYNHELRLNEVRITFMKNLTDTGYVFLGVYRLSQEQSDTTRCVWERVAEECDLSRLNYLEELRN